MPSGGRRRPRGGRTLINTRLVSVLAVTEIALLASGLTAAGSRTIRAASELARGNTAVVAAGDQLSASPPPLSAESDDTNADRPPTAAHTAGGPVTGRDRTSPASASDIPDGTTTSATPETPGTTPGDGVDSESPARDDAVDSARELRIGETERVAHLTGSGSLNATARRWNVHGTDLGHSFRHDGALYMVFGDTYGPGGPHALIERAWRSNVMARIEDTDPRNGLEFAGMITGPDGDARELFGTDAIPGTQKTVIPTNGISVGGRMFLHYMSVRRWLQAGHWEVDFSGLAVSDDDGNHWTTTTGVRWGPSSNFAQVAFVEDGEHVYLFGIPQGRSGAAVLARVDRTGLLDPTRYEYWTGDGWVRGDERAAVPVVSGPVGELSVRWSDHHDRWLMLYLDTARQAVVLRSAARLVGPWSPAKTVVTAERFPQLYAPYFISASTCARCRRQRGTVGGADIYYTLSQFGDYNVSLMRTRIRVP